MAIDHESVSFLRKQATQKNCLSNEQTLVSDKTLIQNLNMITDDGQCTRAGAMLFGNPEEVIVGSYIRIDSFSQANGNREPMIHEEVHGPLVLQAQK